MRRLHAALVSAVLGGVALARAPLARAQAPVSADDARKADALFEEGRALLEKGDFAGSCPKFVESQRLDPALGTLMNIGLCQEGMGKVASAAATFTDAADQAKAAGDTKRVDVAAQHLRTLAPRVPHLTIVATVDRPAGFAVEVNGAPVTGASNGLTIALDPGEITIVASAPGFVAYRAKLKLIDGDAETVTIPQLEPMNPDDKVEPPASAAHHGHRKLIAISVGGVGVVALGFSGALAYTAKSKYDSAFDSGLCTHVGGDAVCTPAGQTRTDAARKRGNTATIIGGVGLAAIGAGVVLYLTAHDAPTGETAPRATLVPVIDGDGGGLAILGSF